MKSISKIPLFVFSLAVLPSLVFLYFFDSSKAYEDKTTHRALTDEIIDFYNLFYEPKITAEQKEWIIQGSADEDIYPRWMNHYYDPVYNAGWQGEGSGYFPDWFVKGGARALVADQKPVSSLDWLRNQELQTAYSEFGGNRTWDRALYEIAKNNNEKEAYYALGFILHLMEDATVPDHTRNDSHAPGIGGDEGSPYEQYADQFTRENLNIAADLRNAGYKPAEKNTVGYYLHSLALYSNKNFFSKDTVLDKKYNEPKIVSEWKIGDYLYGIGQEDSGVKFPLVFIDKKIKENSDGTLEISREYRLKNHPDYGPILRDYFVLLSRQAIINGAGVINLFHQEAEKAKQNPENLISPPEFKIANQAISLFSEINKNGVYQGAADAFERAMKKYVVHKPLDFTMNLAASAIRSIKNTDPKYLVAGLRGMDSVKEDRDNQPVLINDIVNQMVDAENPVSAIPAAKEKEAVILAIPPKTELPRSDILISSKTEKTKVKFIIDGDTFVLEDDTRIRLIGIDAPEQDKCFYGEAKDMLADLILGKEIIMERDISDMDQYGRLLRYVRINDILVNDYMIREGFAEAREYGPDIKYREKLAESQNYARNNESGLWKECDKENQKLNIQNQMDYFIAGIGNNNPPVESASEPELEPESESELEPESEPEQAPAPAPENNSDESEDIIPPITPFDINIANGDIFAFSDDVGTADGTQINIFGKGEENSVVIISVNPVYEATAASNGTWQKEITLNEGENGIKIKSKDKAGNESEEVAINVILDSIGPAARISIANYGLMSMVFNVGWLAAEEDAATTTFEPQYKIGANGEWQNLAIENNGRFSAPKDKTVYYFRVRVRDINGNQGDWSEIAEAEINTKPVVFNEIAWMGTRASYNDEWLELYNASGHDVDLRGWIIEAADGTPNISITDASADPIIIFANSYFLLERTNDFPVSNIEADFIYTGALENMEAGAELLRLRDPNNNIIDQISAWYAGDNDSKQTMERVRSDVGLDVSANWLSYEGEGIGALDANGNPILGTPKSQNSVHNKQYAISGNVDNDTVLYKSNSPYLVYDNFNILENKTVVIEAGVEVQVAYGAQIDVNGTIKSLGSANERVVFTSSKENPQAGDWRKLYFSPTSVNSEMNYTDILYGGRWGGQSAAIEVATSTVAFDNILISGSEYRGLWLKNSASAVKNAVFDNINTQPGSAMIEINGGSPQISDSVFKNSKGGYSSYGINVFDGVSPIISGNSLFNTNYPIHIIRTDPVLSGNTASGNSYNGIWFGSGYEIGSDVVFEKDLPYYINSTIPVRNNAVLTINAGTEMRFDSIGGIEIFDGTLKAVGTNDSRIKFTGIDSGVWKWIYFTEDASVDSELNYVILENGGNDNWLTGAMLKIENVAININNAEIKNSATKGILLINSDSVISGVLFECNASNDICGKSGRLESAALDIQNSGPLISDSVFRRNRIGIKADEYSDPVFENITFGEGDEANLVNTEPVDLLEW